MNGAAHALPAGACDCHTHVVGDTRAWPMVADRHYTPGPASVADLREHMERVGLQRTVIVQPSFYGTDNGCMLQALDALQGAGRGVAVVDDAITPAALEDLHARGIRGLRVNVESAGIRDPLAVEAAFTRWAERIAPLGWHLQVYAALQTLASLADFFAALPVPVVLDHFAMVPAGTSLNYPAGKRLLSLVESGRAYVKLSAPYRVQPIWPAADVDALAQAFLAANAERVLWGSDWPHTNREPGKGPLEVSRYRDIAPVALHETLTRWLPSHAVRRQVLVDNPAGLYGF